MAFEIERKFLVRNDSWKKQAQGVRYRQAYLNSTPERTVRVRTVREHGFLTIKGLTSGATRVEYEYAIPYAEASAMIDGLCEPPVLEKDRYLVEHDGFVWEVDVFFGDNLGLVVAEIELEDEAQHFAKPDWVGKEVTGDPRYYNSNLCKHPYARWRKTSGKEEEAG